MSDKIDWKRRRLLQALGVGAAFAAAPAFPIVLKKEAFEKAGPPCGKFSPDVELELVAKVDQVPILPGAPTRVWRYEAKVLKGYPQAVIPLKENYLGPILKFRTGQKVRIRFYNRLPQNHIVHWHGVHTPSEMDAHPIYEVGPGESYLYEFEVKNRASTNWFHPHSHHATAAQAYAGLAGLFIVEDEEELALPLPRGDYDLPLIIQDRTFTADNQLWYDNRGPIGIIGFLGERILVNGRPDFAMEVENRAYRFRLLNGSNSRVYKLAWSDGEPITVIGTDGGLLERPVTRPYLVISPGERYEIWRDFQNAKGREVILESLEYSGVMPAMYEQHMRMMAGHGRGMGGMMRGMGGMMQEMGAMAMFMRHIPAGSRFAIARFAVTRTAPSNLELPDRLRSVPRYRIEDTANPDRPRPVAIGMRGRRFTLNGRSFELTEALPIETIPLGTFQLIEIFHFHGEGMAHGQAGTMEPGAAEGPHAMAEGGQMDHRGMGRMEMDHGQMGGMGMGGMDAMQMAQMLDMAHPMHFHGEYFQIVERVAPTGHGVHSGAGYETVKEGLVNEGYQDTVLVMPGERVRLIMPFRDYKGLFVYHCHNLEHEDGDMMRNFKVV
ncbi:multicopper oxidase domain-containing protein [Methylothermus subterraneus]